MSYDLLVWKWSSAMDAGNPAEVLEAIDEDDPHPALTRFDIASFEAAIRARFGDVDDDPDVPFLYDVSDFTGVPANWVHVSVNWSQVGAICPVIVEIARSQGLAVYDPQEDRML